MRQFRHNPARRGGFTLIELLAVMLILTILISLIIGIGLVVRNKAAEQNTANVQRLLTAAIEKYLEKNDKLPATVDDIRKLQVLLSTDKGAADVEAKIPQNGRSTDGKSYVDGWGREMEFDPIGAMNDRPLIISAGPDGEFGTPNDKDNIRSDGAQ